MAELWRIEIVALTGWGQEEDRRRSQEAGFDHHMVKPVDPQTIMKLLPGLKSPP
jgi:CheY-like chemotaxis protein